MQFSKVFFEPFCILNGGTVYARIHLSPGTKPPHSLGAGFYPTPQYKKIIRKRDALNAFSLMSPSAAT